VTARQYDPGLLDTPRRRRAWHDSYVSVLPLVVVLIVAAVAILGGMIVVAMGRGGELARSDADVRPLDGELVTAADVALLRPPAALWGYDMRTTDEALNRVARTVTERDVEIASLRRQLADLQAKAADPGEPGAGTRPQALPLRRAVSGPSRPPAGDQSRSPWERSGQAQPRPPRPEPDEPDEPETGTGGRA